MLLFGKFFKKTKKSTFTQEGGMKKLKRKIKEKESLEVLFKLSPEEDPLKGVLAEKILRLRLEIMHLMLIVEAN